MVLQLVKSKRQCLEAIPASQPNQGYSGVKTAPCDFNNDKQKWNLGAYLISRDDYNYCLKYDTSRRSSVVTMGPCEYCTPTISDQYFADCSTVPDYVRITST
ncbi:hypothetical protein THRCLA_21858 [Thraustotheca clavata]|uniref:Uncharacterized protein n=1 Tax=Thraustotheca clavata TaxID=74557 RepID=A0A1V9ZLR8_9STRA|nr:hypothetical protein THRCLA_21858 [Thraustotheca clavata]